MTTNPVPRAAGPSIAATAKFTSVRVLCNDTLQIAVADGRGAIKVLNRSQLESEVVEPQLGVTVEPWSNYVAKMKDLVACPVDPDSVEGLLRRVLVYPGQPGTSPVVNEQAVRAVRALYDGGGRGAQLASSRGTAWGLLNRVTEFVDHHRRARTDDFRLDAAWFGQGAQFKRRAWETIVELTA